MSEMIQNVQRAIGKQLGTGMAPRAMAVAAIEAMREPSTAVRLVGGYVQKHGNSEGDTYAYAIWQAMIDGALETETV